jgi:hypothetical protein
MARIGALAATVALVLALAPVAVAAAKPSRLTVSAPLPQITPIGAVAAPDGSVWFGEDGVSRLGRFAADGKLSEFHVPGQAGDASELLHVEAVGPDGRVWFSRDYEFRAGVLDPATGAVKLLKFDFNFEALTVSADGAVWVVGSADETELLRIAPDGTRKHIVLGKDQESYAIAPSTLSPGAVIVLRDGPGIDAEPGEGALRVDQIRADGVVQPIKLPNESGGIPTIASGAAGTYIGLGRALLRVDPDLVARPVGGLGVPRYVVDGGIGLGGDGSIWIAADPDGPVVRLAPGVAPARIDTGIAEYGGIAVASSNDAWIAEYPASGFRRERLVRVTPTGQVLEHLIGVPPTATATALSGRNANIEAGKLVVGRRDRLRVRVRCSGPCTVRVIVTARVQPGASEYTGKTVRLTRAGARIVTLRRTQRLTTGETSPTHFALYAYHTKQSAYLSDGPASRPGAGTGRPLP